MTQPFTRSCIRLATVGFLLSVMLIGYAWFSESRAESRARAFCDSVRIGDSSAPLLERAYVAGADSRQTKWLQVGGDEPWLPVTFTGATPLSRHICSIHGGNVVREFHYVYLD